MKDLSRRRFLEDSLALLTVGAAGIAPIVAPAATIRRRRGPNEQLRVAVVGVHGQGMSHVGSLLGMSDVTIAAICDADTACFARPVREIEAKTGRTPRTYQDIRKLLEDKEIDAISSATPNHWHALIAIWSMQAGKDVYIEKPASHEVVEGRRMIEAARKYGRICQVGTQSRSTAGMREAMEFLHSGKLGKIRLARALCYKPRGSIGLAGGPQTPPSTVDYDLWLGPAPMVQPTRRQFHYDWHWFWDYGNGDLGNQGVHEMDKARWGLGKSTLPKSVMTIGGRFGYKDDGQTPNTEVIFLDWDDARIIFEVRGLSTPALNGARVGNIWYGTEGILVAPSYSSATAYDNSGTIIRKFDGGGSHHRNWVNAIYSRDPADLNCDIAEGHLSAALCHMGNISLRTGSLQPFDTTTKRFGDDKDAHETIGRTEEHLAANGVVLSDTRYMLGRKLAINAGAENFGGDHAANALLTRRYRKPYIVPDKV